MCLSLSLSDSLRSVQLTIFYSHTVPTSLSFILRPVVLLASFFLESATVSGPLTVTIKQASDDLI